jgi:hypothetical protein
MTEVWMLIGAGVAAVLAVLAKSRFRREQDYDLGTVSHNWIAEQRFGARNEPHR